VIIDATALAWSCGSDPQVGREIREERTYPRCAAAKKKEPARFVVIMKPDDNHDHLAHNGRLHARPFARAVCEPPRP
jgi:hypothetical protein